MRKLPIEKNYPTISYIVSNWPKSKNILRDIKEIKVIEFDHNDVVRHHLVSKIIKAYQNKSIDDKN